MPGGKMAHWQKNFRKIPPEIAQKIKGFKTKSVVVGCVARLSELDIGKGVFRHLGIAIEKGKLIYPGSIVPQADAGRYSNSNANGHDVVRKDLPMITKTYSFDAPNYGDWANGSHEVSWDKPVYQRQFVPPAENEIRIELVGEDRDGDGRGFVLRFTVDQPLTIGDKRFRGELFRLLNLLQESVGSADVFPSDAKLEDYLRTIYVNWEILPPGERDNNIAKITAAITNADEEARKRIVDRYDFFDKMKPEALIQGQGGFRRYFGAKFSDELVAFENMEYGNAVYVMRKDWKEASKKTKQELLASGRDGKDFFRVVHTKGWKSQVKKVLSDNRGRA
jgi:hypothetical protein